MGFSRQGYWSGLPFPFQTFIGYVDPIATWITVLWRGGDVFWGVPGLYPQDAFLLQLWQPEQPQTFRESVVENRWGKAKQKRLESCSICFEFVAGSPKLMLVPSAWPWATPFEIRVSASTFYHDHPFHPLHTQNPPNPRKQVVCGGGVWGCKFHQTSRGDFSEHQPRSFGWSEIVDYWLIYTVKIKGFSRRGEQVRMGSVMFKISGCQIPERGGITEVGQERWLCLLNI